VQIYVSLRVCPLLSELSKTFGSNTVLLQGCEYVCPIIGAMERLNSSFIHVGALEGMAAELT
jgi:hypothetical protein